MDVAGESYQSHGRHQSYVSDNTSLATLLGSLQTNYI